MVEVIIDYIYGSAAKDTRGCKYTSWETYFILAAGALCSLCTLSRRCRLYFINNFLRTHFCIYNVKSSRIKVKTYCSIGKKLGRVKSLSPPCVQSVHEQLIKSQLFIEIDEIKIMLYNF